MFWQAAELADDSRSLLAATPTDPAHGADYTYVTGVTKPPVRLDMKLRMRPMGRDVLGDLVESGHLDPAVMEQMPTFTVAEWQAELNGTVYNTQKTGDGTCEEYERLMYPKH